MTNKICKKVEDHATVGEIQSKINKLESDCKVLNRLYFINDLLHGFSVVEASKKAGISKATGYEWLKRWNNRGFDGLIPNYGIGRPSKLSLEEKTKLKKLIIEKDLKITKEVHKLILDEFNVEYSIRQIERIMRGFGFVYGKSDIRSSKRPKDVEKQFKKTFR